MKHIDYVKLDTTTYKALIGQRLLVATAVVVALAFVDKILSGGKGSDEMAMRILESWLYFLGIAVLGVNMGQYGLQRFSSKEWRQAGPAPAVAVQADEAQVSVDASVGGKASAKAKREPQDDPPADEHEWATGDPRAGVL